MFAVSAFHNPIRVKRHYRILTKLQYRIAGFCRENFNVASHGIRNIKIRYIFHLVTLSHEIL